MALCVSGDRIGVRRILNVKRIINTTRESQKLLLAQGMRFKVAITFEGEGLWRTCIWVPKPTTNCVETGMWLLSGHQFYLF